MPTVVRKISEKAAPEVVCDVAAVPRRDETPGNGCCKRDPQTPFTDNHYHQHCLRPRGTVWCKGGAYAVRAVVRAQKVVCSRKECVVQAVRGAAKQWWCAPARQCRKENP